MHFLPLLMVSCAIAGTENSALKLATEAIPDAIAP
jgi:hypothetical protein